MLKRLLVAATMLSICLGLASSAQAAAPREFYGVISATDPTSPQVDRMGKAKVGTLRLPIVWGSAQPDPNNGILDWAHYDDIIGAAARNGIRVLPTIYGSPKWVATKPNFPPTGRFLDDFKSFVRAAVQRYGPNGIFWTFHPEIPKLPITDWQIWNEENSPSFWQPKPNPAQYVDLLRAAHDGIKGADPSARIILGGLFRSPRIRSAIGLSRYLPSLYQAGARDLFDAVAVHPYAITPRDALKAVREARQIMSRNGDAGKPLWITEIGWATGGQKTVLTVSRGRQARYLRQGFNLLAANRTRLNISGAVWYSFMDVPGRIWVGHTGLFTVGGKPKPSWAAFARLTGGSPG